MLIDRGRFGAAYGNIRDAAREASEVNLTSVLVLSANDADAVVATRMLVKLFRDDGIQYRLVPVAGYTDVQKEVLEAGDAITSIVMINCGGTSNLKDLVDVPENCVIYVIDSHLPFHHTNINDDLNIVILSWDKKQDDVPNDGDSDVENEHEGDFLDDDDDFDEDGDGRDELEEVGEAGSAASSPKRNRDENGSDTEAAGAGSKRRRERGAGAGPEPGDGVIGDDSNDGNGGRREGQDEQLDPEAQAPGAADGDADDDGSQADSEDADGAGKDRSKQQKKKFNRLRQRKDDSDDSDGDGDDDAAGGGGGRRGGRELNTRQLAVQLEKQTRKRHRQICLRWRAYYSGQKFGLPVSFLMFEMCDQLNKCRNDLLWLACVGCTAPFLAEQISGSMYREIYNRLRDHVSALNKDDIPVDEKNPLERKFAGRDGYIGILEDDRAKGRTAEPRFLLMRHMSLYDSMRCSEYVSTRLALNTNDSGTSKLDKLIALTGVPLFSVKADYKHMRRDERERFMWKLRGLLEDTEEWHMPPDELFYPSFFRLIEKSGRPMTAADVVHSINGLLSAGNVTSGMMEAVLRSTGAQSDDADAPRPSGDSPGMQGAGAGSGSGGALVVSGRSNPLSVLGSAGVGSAVELHALASKSWRDNYAKAHSSLSRKYPDLFQQGVDRAMGLRHAVLRVAHQIVRSGNNSPSLKNGDYVRWVEVDEDVTDAERRLFAQPHALSELGRMIIRLQRDAFVKWRLKGGKVSTKPVIITLRHQRKSEGMRANLDGSGEDGSAWITVMGLPVLDREGGEAKSNFLDAFRQSARGCDARYLLDSFDSSTMVMDGRDLQEFMRGIDPATTKA